MTVKKIKRSDTLEKIFANYTYNKQLVLRTYKELLKHNSIKANKEKMGKEV